MRDVLRQPTFFGIAWATFVWFEVAVTAFFVLLFCGCVSVTCLCCSLCIVKVLVNGLLKFKVTGLDNTMICKEE